ncbi:MAG: aspartate carbamoyltransferase catalytic subunit [Sandaracinus sp.]|nr:aspartate carbamoyltransferase catalytic subunit [Sandaracinus sp.]MCB9620601.1 aspartate carbamoyltransferase catalytic subunit [Sandaracinus sp.]
MSGLPHLLDLRSLSRDEVVKILDTAEAFFEVSRRPVRKVPTLRGKTIINLFYEASTRTRTSFEIAAKRLSADAVNMSVSTSSVSKGETLYDTCKTLEAMHPDVVVIRHSASGAPHYVASKLRCGVVNAGDGMHAHPTQALLDAFTIRRAKGTLEGLNVTIVGDVAHSRVARCNSVLLRSFGCRVRVVGPRTLVPPHFAEAFDVETFHELEPALEGADVVMCLRIQRERLQDALLPSLREYSRTFGVGQAQLALAKKDAIVMHPGPMNRGVEIAHDVADGPQSVVLDQVEAGVAVRMAVLYLLAGGEEGAREAAA